MIIKYIIEETAPYIIHLLEALGMLIITIAAVKAFITYVRSSFSLDDHEIKVKLAKALAFALEFKMGSEILKTVTIRTLDEMIILASVIVLRAILAFVIHWEIKADIKRSGYLQNQSVFADGRKRIVK